ncbi:hypothetical protein [Streptomyces sp. NPDC002276]
MRDTSTLTVVALRFLHGAKRIGRELLLAALAGFMAAAGTGTFRASIGDDFMLHRRHDGPPGPRRGRQLP